MADALRQAAEQHRGNEAAFVAACDPLLADFARRVMGREAVDPARLLFALYTYSALLTKLLAVAAVTPFFDPDHLDRLADWTQLSDDDLLERLREVESGMFFRRMGVRNFTEGDFFGWYCDEWTPAVARQVKQLLTELSKFDPDAVEQAPERVRDLFKTTQRKRVSSAPSLTLRHFCWRSTPTRLPFSKVRTFLKTSASPATTRRTAHIVVWRSYRARRTR